LITATGISHLKIKNKTEESTVFLECLSSRKTFYIYSPRFGGTRWDGWINGPSDFITDDLKLSCEKKKENNYPTIKLSNMALYLKKFLLDMSYVSLTEFR